MKSTFKNALFTALIGCASAAYAASSAEGEGSSFLLALFLGFGALIIVFQLFPGGMLFFSMVKGLFSSAPKDAAADKADRAL